MTNDKLYSINARLKNIMRIDAADQMRKEIGSIITEIDSALMSAGQMGNVCKAMQKLLRRTSKEARECLRYSKVIDGKQVVLDGFMLIRSNVIYDTIPQYDGEYINVDKIMTADFMDTTKKKQLIVPSVNAVKAFIAGFKPRYDDLCGGKMPKDMSALYRLASVDKHDDNPYVDAELLLNILEAFPDAEMFYTTSVAGIYVKGNDGDGLLLPVRVDVASGKFNIMYANEEYASVTEHLYAAKQDDAEADGTESDNENDHSAALNAIMENERKFGVDVAAKTIIEKIKHGCIMDISELDYLVEHGYAKPE